MKHEEFAERAAKRLLDMADRLEEEGRRLGGNGKVSARAKEMRVAAFMVRGEAEAITRAENEPSAEPPLKNPSLKSAGLKRGSMKSRRIHSSFL